MLVLTFIFAVLNLCLGFALAMYLKDNPFASGKAGGNPDISLAKAEAGPVAANKTLTSP